MTYNPHTLVEFTGTWTYADAGAESWAFGIRIVNAAGGWAPLTDPADYIATVGPTLKSWWGTAASLMASTAKLGLIKCNNIDALGHYMDPVTHSYDAGGQLGATSMSLPVNVTAAWSFSTGRSSGRARHGRIYPPLGLGLLSDAALFVTPSTTQMVTAAKALLSLLHVTSPANSSPAQPVIASKVDGSIHNITGVWVDNRIDTQRRRIKQVVGTRNVSSWP